MLPDHAIRMRGLREGCGDGLDLDDIRARIAFLDFQAGSAAIVRLRDWAVCRADPPTSSTVLAPGCGAGAVLRALRDRVPGGVVIGVEADVVLRELAAARLADLNVQILAGVPEQLPMADESVDLVLAEEVLSRTTHPAAATAEMARVVRPGGTVAIIDADHLTLRVAGLDPASSRLLLERVVPLMAAHPGCAREVPQLLTAAGLVLDPDIEASAVTLVGRQLLDWPLPVRLLHKAVELGALPADDARRIVESVLQSAQEGTGFISASKFAFVSHKPEESP